MKTQRIEVRLSNLDKKIITRKSKSCGLSVSEFVRRAALELEVKFKLTPEELEIYKILHKYKCNFDSIANMYKGKNPYINQEVRFLAEEIKHHLKKFQ